jgi:glycosyltransferase involved in cell wall biosynthesis
MMNDIPLVSLIIPCYNQGEFLEECLISVFSSTHKHIEVIVINDGSTDNSLEIITSLNTKYNFILFDQINSGPSIARNNGILISKGKYILPLDADDKIGNTYIENSVNQLASNNKTGIVYCKAHFFGEKQGEWKLPQYSFEQILTQNLIFNCALFRKEDYNKTIGYNPNMKEGWEDWDFWLSLIELGLEVERLDEIGFYYRIRHNSRERSLDKGKVIRLRKQIYQNHINLYLKHFNNPIIQHFEIENLKEFKKSFHHLLNSKDYKIGKFVLSPIRFIKNIIQK